MFDAAMDGIVRGMALGESLGASTDGCKSAEVLKVFMPIYGKSPVDELWSYSFNEGKTVYGRGYKQMTDTGRAVKAVLQWLDSGDIGGLDGWLAQNLSGAWDAGELYRAQIMGAIGSVDDYRLHPYEVTNEALARNGVCAVQARSLDEAFYLTIRQAVVTNYHPLPVLTCCVHTWLSWQLFLENWVLGRADWFREFHGDFVKYIERADSTIPEITAWVQRVERRDAMTDAMVGLQGAMTARCLCGCRNCRRPAVWGYTIRCTRCGWLSGRWGGRIPTRCIRATFRFSGHAVETC